MKFIPYTFFVAEFDHLLDNPKYQLIPKIIILTQKLKINATKNEVALLKSAAS